MVVIVHAFRVQQLVKDPPESLKVQEFVTDVQETPVTAPLSEEKRAEAREV